MATYLAHYDGAIRFSAEEIESVRFWDAEEIAAALGSGVFTPNFEQEWQLWRSWRLTAEGRLLCPAEERQG